MADQNQNQTVESKDSLPDQKQTRKAKGKKADTADATVGTLEKEPVQPQEPTTPPTDSSENKVEDIVITAVFENSRSTCKLSLVVPGKKPLFASVSSVAAKTEFLGSSTGSFKAYWSESEKTDEQATDKEGNLKFNKKEEPIYKTKTTQHNQNWVVGRSALRVPGYVKMTDADNNKVEYFPQLFMGALSSLSDLDLKEMSIPGDKKGKTRKLTIYLVTQSIASGEELKNSLYKYKAFEFKGTKFKLKFIKNAESQPENFGVALHAFEDVRSNPEPMPEIIGTADCGEGTLMIIPYSINGSIPSDNDAFLHGGGGMAALKYQFLKTAGDKDASSETDNDYLEQVLFAAKWENNSILLEGENHSGLTQALNLAITNWLRNSQAQVAIRNAAKIALRYPLYLCGGGFACEPVFEMFKAELIKNGVPEGNIKKVPNPQFTGIKQTGDYYASKQQA